jgi:hypothetical protein
MVRFFLYLFDVMYVDFDITSSIEFYDNEKKKFEN